MDERMIPYFSHEGDMARMERANKRLWIVILVLIIAFVSSNVYWIWRENQYEDIVVEQEVDTGQGDATVTGVGDIYGTSETNNQSTQTKDGR
jgi:hypothetical protein